MNLTIASLFVAGALILGALFFATANKSAGEAEPTRENVTMASSTQVIRITAKGGYAPRLTIAKAGVSTELVLVTNNTFDCSSALVIPALNYRKNLPVTGETRIPVPPQSAGSTLRGTCTMGMYAFAINFE